MMKQNLGITVMLAAVLLAACGQEDAKTKDANNTNATEKTEQTTNVASLNKVNSKLQEPKEDTVCEFCNMKVYDWIL